MAYSVEGKTAIVTGAGSGINYSFAKLLLSKGCNVLIADLALRPEAEALLSTYSSSPKALFLKTDVTSWPALSGMFAFTLTHFCSIDIVCPGAGVFEPPFSNFWYPPSSDPTSPSKDDPNGDPGTYKTLEINITHPVRTTQLAIQYFLREKREGRVLHVSSVAGQVHGIGTPLYFTSKHAINGFIRSLGGLEKELGIRVNGVAPGIIKTPLWTEHPEKMSMLGENHLWITPEDVADVMYDLIVNPEHTGGTILEVGYRKVRKVEAFNDPGPSGEEYVGTRTGETEAAVYERLRSGEFEKL